MLSIFTTDLAAYNKGFLYGDWFTLPVSDDELSKEIDKVLKGGEAICAIEYGYELHEEYFITDWEWEDVELFEISEYTNLFKLNQQLQQLQDLQQHQLKSISFLLSEGIASDIDDAIEKSDDVIVYENTTMEQLAFDLMGELYGIDYKLPSIIANNIDYNGIARELEYEGRYFCIGDDIYEYTA
jgi:hypothetical protein